MPSLISGNKKQENTSQSTDLVECDFQGLPCMPLLKVDTGDPVLAEDGRSRLNKHFCCLPLVMERSEGTLALLRLALEGIGDWWQVELQ